MDFQVGDVVELKSGGPKMTVRMVGNNGLIYCVWFNIDGGSAHHAEHHFPPEALKKVPA